MEQSVKPYGEPGRTVPFGQNKFPVRDLKNPCRMVY